MKDSRTALAAACTAASRTGAAVATRAGVAACRVWGRRAGRLVLVTVCSVAGAVAVSAPASAVTLGHTGTPAFNGPWSSGLEIVGRGGAYAIYDFGTITSFSTQSGACPLGAGGAYNFQVLRPVDSRRPDNQQYVVVGDTGNQTDPCDGQLHSYPVNIPVQPGDVLGVYTSGSPGWYGVLNSGEYNYGVESKPAVGQSVFVFYAYGRFSADESATFVPTPPDGTPPTVSASRSPAADAHGFNAGDTTVDLTATDNPGGSGVASVTYSLSGAQSQDETTVTGDAAAPLITAEGVTTVTYHATDVAGNVSADQSIDVDIDKSAPTMTASVSPAPNAAGWNRTNVTVQLGADDHGGSGVQSIAYRVGNTMTIALASSVAVPVSAEGTTTVTYHATDAVGHDGTDQTIVVKLDKTAPMTTAANGMAGPRPAGGRGAAGALVRGVATDGGGSGVDHVTVTLTPLPYGAPYQVTATCDSGCGTPQAAWSLQAPADLPNGLYKVTAQATDVAGNTGPAARPAYVPFIRPSGG